MQEVFEKIIEKLEAKQNKADEKCKDIVVKDGHSLEYEFYNGESIAYKYTKEIVKQVAAEYNNECNHKWVFQESQYKTTVSGYEHYTALYHRVDVYFCEKCCEIKKIEQKESVNLPFGGIHKLQSYAPIWYKPKEER